MLALRFLYLECVLSECIKKYEVSVNSKTGSQSKIAKNEEKITKQMLSMPT